MNFSMQQVCKLIREYGFTKLFIEELGWNRCNIRPVIVQVDGMDYKMIGIAEIGGIIVLTCENEVIPEYVLRRKIERQLARVYLEHIIIFYDKNKSRQVWQWVNKETGKESICREHSYFKDQSGLAMAQKLLEICFQYQDFDENGKVHTADALSKLRGAMDVDRITKKFYEKFNKERETFQKAIKNITDDNHKSWYVSVLLNRLMFIYFIQKKNLLNNDSKYLQSMLAKYENKGTNFYYKNFLSNLFFEGLAKKENERSEEVTKVIGNIPYLNGGLFIKHEIEELYPDIQIPVTAFENIFSFFEHYQWHLDDRPLRKDNEINPDVLGFIFERYVNQKQMGAYYTKEDITGYISKNTILPYIFDQISERTKKLGKEYNPYFLLQQDPDGYIYDSIKKGVDKTLPDNIKSGLDGFFNRELWNREAAEEYALPTETWREVIDRRNRYKNLRKIIEDGQIQSINDLITYNLNIIQFSQDFIININNPQLLLIFYEIIENITILDPACGSGAFLFSAINILEALYEACFDRMNTLLSESYIRCNEYYSNELEKISEIIGRVNTHPNQRYFIYKSIMLNNLYGVDIMDEAVEICKLRLFLKLIAEVNDGEKVEPLPDTDFNIRPGNTLVGFYSYKEVEKAVLGEIQIKFDLDNEMDGIKASFEKIRQLHDTFRNKQMEHGSGLSYTLKFQLKEEILKLKERLNLYLAKENGINIDNIEQLCKWQIDYKPFNWFLEFYGIMANGGFDVIIGNPPYVNLNKVSYHIKDTMYTCHKCNDLFALMTERIYMINKNDGRLGIIIPLSATSTSTMTPLKELMIKKSLISWTSYFSASDQPSSLFIGVRHRLLILLAKTKCSKAVHPTNNYTTRFIKWFSEERKSLFETKLNYLGTSEHNIDKFAKASFKDDAIILSKMKSKGIELEKYIRKSGIPIYYHNAPVHWGKVFDFIPYYEIVGTRCSQSSHLKCIYLENNKQAGIVLCLLNSSLFYWFNWLFSNCRDLTSRDIGRVPIDLNCFDNDISSELCKLGKDLMEDLIRNSRVYIRNSNNNITKFDSFYPMYSKHIINNIDRLLAKYYSLTESELDYIINYDYKYRMGKGALEEEI